MVKSQWATPELESLRLQLEPLWAQQKKLDHQLESILPRLRNVEEGVRKAQRQLAGGDQAAAAELERLEAERRTVEHLRDGLKMTLKELDERIAPLQQQSHELRQAAKNQEREELFKAMSAELEARIDNFLGEYEAGCQSLAGINLLKVRIREEFGSRGAAVIDSLNTTKLMNPLGHLVNVKQWKRFGTEGGSFTVVPLLPPEGLRPYPEVETQKAATAAQSK